MDQEVIAQTMFDQLVSSENSQILKSLIPYLSFSGQKILAAYAKTQELYNTVQMFSHQPNDIQMCSSGVTDPLAILNDIRKFSYGESKKRLDQAVNLFALIELMQTVNE